MTDILQVRHYARCCDGRTWGVHKVTEYSWVPPQPSQVISKTYFQLDQVYQTLLRKADREFDRQIAQWEALPWWRRAFVHRPLYTPIFDAIKKDAKLNVV